MIWKLALATSVLLVAALLLRRHLPYWHTFWYNLDVLVNGLLGGNRGETLSSRLGKMQARGSRVAKIVCRLLHLVDGRHCQDSVDEDYRGEGMPVAELAVVVIWSVVTLIVLAWAVRP